MVMRVVQPASQPAIQQRKREAGSEGDCGCVREKKKGDESRRREEGASVDDGPKPSGRMDASRGGGGGQNRRDLLERRRERCGGRGFRPPSGWSVVLAGPPQRRPPNLHPLIKQGNKDMHVIRKSRSVKGEQKERDGGREINK